jgi:zinc/manganese transport system substrate-binding protein
MQLNAAATAGAPLGQVLAVCLACLLLAVVPCRAAEPLRVVATFSILGDFVRQVGGDRVALTTLVGPDADAHAYVPAPAAIAAVARADVLVSNGLGFEGWMDRLTGAAGFRGTVVAASTGIAPRGQAEGRSDPHAFQIPQNAVRYVENIAKALCTADAAGCPEFRANAAAYQQTLRALDGEVRAEFEKIPPGARLLVIAHEALGYFADAYGLTLLAPAGISTSSEPSAADVARVIRQMRAAGAKAIFLEGVTDPRLLESIAREIGAPVAGRLYADALSAPEGPAATYVNLIRHNTRVVVAALSGK